MSTSIKYSLIIPCYNEQKNLPKLFQACEKVVSQRDDLEIIFVNNGSKDGSAGVFKKLLSNNHHGHMRCVTVKINRGYGFGILSGLKTAHGLALGWTHADLQTNPDDFLKAIDVYETSSSPNCYIKGRRQRRALRDQIFTFAMSIFEFLIFGKWLSDINAQPNLFSRDFFESLDAPPHDFSLDLYFYVSALQRNLSIQRFPVFFGNREHGIGHNDAISSKIKLSLTTIRYSLMLKSKLIR